MTADKADEVDEAEETDESEEPEGAAEDGASDGPNDHVPFEVDWDVHAAPITVASASSAAAMAAFDRGIRMPKACAPETSNDNERGGCVVAAASQTSRSVRRATRPMRHSFGSSVSDAELMQ